MNLHCERIYGNEVYYDGPRFRWLDARGLGVTKVTMDDVRNAGSWTQTAVSAGTGTSIIKGIASGKILTYASANENDGIQMQWPTEPFALTSDDPLHFGVKFQISEKTQSDAMIGIATVGTTALGGVTDGVYFLTADGSAAMTFVNEKATTATSSAAMTLVDATDYWAEFVWNGTDLKAYIDGVLVATHTTNLPTAVLTPTIAYLNGTGTMTGDGLTITQFYCVQINSDRT